MAQYRGDMSSEILEVRFTCGDEQSAERIARVLIDRGLAACVHRSPITSRYEWRGEITDDAEIALVAMTTAGRCDEVVAAIAGEHPYELPAITWTEIRTTAAYARWVRDQVTGQR